MEQELLRLVEIRELQYYSTTAKTDSYACTIIFCMELPKTQLQNIKLYFFLASDR